MSEVIRATHYQPGEYPQQDADIAAAESESAVKWAGFGDDERLAALALVRDCLVHSLKTLDVWLPRSLVVQDGHRLDVFIGIDLREVDQEVLRRRVEAERELQQTTADLLSMQKELNVRVESDE